MLPESASPLEVMQAAKAKQLDVLTTDDALIHAVFDEDWVLGGK